MEIIEADFQDFGKYPSLKHPLRIFVSVRSLLLGRNLRAVLEIQSRAEAFLFEILDISFCVLPGDMKKFEFGMGVFLST